MTITKSGELASFYTVNKAPIKHLKVYFSPKQAGTGDPSPSNVREINGYNEIVTEITNNLVQIIPDASSIELENGTLTYLGDNTFYIDKTLDSTVNFKTFSISPFTMPANSLYTLSIFIDKSATLVTSPVNFAIAFRGAGGSLIARCQEIHESGHYFYGGNTGIQKIIDNLTIAFPPGSQNIKMKIYLYLEDNTQGAFYKSLSLGDTYYGGYVDFVTGELVETDWGVVLDGSSDEFWAANGTDGFYTQPQTTKPMETILYCNQYKVHQGRMTTKDMDEGEIAMNATGWAVQVFDTSQTDWRAYLSENPLQLVGQLKEPIIH